jgi:hypothetical protein
MKNKFKTKKISSKAKLYINREEEIAKLLALINIVEALTKKRLNKINGLSYFIVNTHFAN